MSLKQAELELKTLLGSDEPLIFALKGKWGVGKTHLVSEVFEGYEAHDYALISLFGIGSLDDLKQAVVAKLIANRIKPSQSNSKPISPVAESLSNLFGIFDKSGIAGKVGNLAVDIWLSSDFENAIIVIDDLERRGNNLDIRDVLGFCTQLKEQRLCKVILIFNEDALDDDKVELEKFREKVIDQEITLQPTPEEVLKVGLKASEGVLYETLKKIEPQNIRGVQKTARFVNKLMEALESYNEKVGNYVKQQATVLAWFYYVRDKDTIPWNFVATFHSSVYDINRYFGRYNGKQDNQLTPDQRQEKLREQQHMEQLASYGYQQTGDLQRAIIDTLEKGYFDVASFKPHLGNLEEDYRKRVANDKLNKVWDIYTANLDDTTDEFADTLRDCFLNNCQYYDLRTLDVTVRFLEQLERMTDVQVLLNTYFSNVVISPDYLRPQNIKHTLSEVGHSEVKKKLEHLSKQRGHQRSTLDILVSWLETTINPDDFDQLSQLTEDDWRYFFKYDIKAHSKYPALKFVRRLAELKNYEDERAKPVWAAVDKALQTIATEGPLNVERIKNWWDNP